MRPLAGIFPTEDFPDLLVGLAAPDDSAVYRVDDTRAIISTVDFFPPVVDDAYDFGAIAAANAMSDVYAMGGRVLMAVNLAAFPDGMDMDILTDILRGGAEKVREAGAVVAGGHTVTDKEPKYGLAVTGEVHPDRIIRKSGARPGDSIILTKPLGSGVVTTALKRGEAHQDHVRTATAVMGRLNKSASEMAQVFGVHAMTDITGYSLMGHSHEMANLSGVDLHMSFMELHWLPGALDYAARDLFAGGLYRNKAYFSEHVDMPDDLLPYLQDIVYDPQTSGGLLMAVASQQADELLTALREHGDDAALIGEVTAGTGRIIVHN